ncbi:MAG: hydrogenase maturation protease [Euryarchaeota archaeon]|nr:hydrogenase maturation protease [Euryarchaeota archaeon]
MDSSTLQDIERLSASKNLFDYNKPRKPVVIIGIGNLTMSDDGAGVQVAYELMKDSSINSKVDIFEVGTRVFDLLECLNERKKAIIIDAYRGGKEPGALHRFVFNIQDFKPGFDISLSLHELTFADAILSAKDIYRLPQKIVVLGVEPFKLEAGIELSLPVQKNLPKLIEMAKEEARCQTG